MGELDLLPDLFGQDWRQSLLQVNSGNVTIYPTPRWIDYAHLLSDPTREDMAQYLRGGELCVPFFSRPSLFLGFKPRLTISVSDMLIHAPRLSFLTNTLGFHFQVDVAAHVHAQ
jgi:hypothetical protein